MVSSTDWKAQLICITGYKGGQRITFEVLKQDGGILSNMATNSSIEVAVGVKREVAILEVDGFDSNTNYTVKVYQKNSFGRSQGFTTVFVSTRGKFYV